MTVATNKLITIEEYLDYEDETDARRYELEDGVLVEMADEQPINPTIAMFLSISLFQLGIPHRQLAIGHVIQVESKQASARKPDLIVHSAGSIAAILDDGRLLRLGAPPPRLVVEVASNSSTDKRSYERDYVSKRRKYAKRGISEYWIVGSVAATVLVLTLSGDIYQEQKFQEQKFVGSERLVSPEFPALQLSVNQIFQGG